jgi:three-Cys-motif partner protein
MSRLGKGSPGDREHRFGGDWTTTKLDILSGYLSAYATALKKSPFKIAYIDAFAGTGYRTLRRSGAGETGPLFPDLIEGAPRELLDGSARLALRIEPRFDQYLFIEKDCERCHQLEKLKEEFPGRPISIHQGDANNVIREICDSTWTHHRAVLFLDPYGMQVEWSTIQRVAETGAIDLWILFPLGIGVNRVLPRSGQIPEGWRQRIDVFFGCTDWYDVFYKEEPATNLFGEEDKQVTKVSLEQIGKYFVERLRSVFPAVAPKPRVLMNSVGCPLYLFCFAVSSPNKSAQGIALRIANHLLGRIDQWP